MSKFTTGITLVFLTIFAVSIAFSWGATGHRIINRKAPMHLPDSMAIWKADSLLFAQHASDADNRKKSGDTSFWAEGERHYIDIDYYPNYHSIPHSLDSMISLFGRSTVWDQGTLPWAIVKEFDSLTAQFRRNDTAIVQTMSDLGHYVGDAHQPLHCTQNYDGQLTGNNGIHSRYETTMINADSLSIIIQHDAIEYVTSPLDYAFDFIYHSNTFVDSIMAADTYAKATSGWNGSGSVPKAYTSALWSKVGNFTIDQFQRATVALASLWYTAWVNSQLPPGISHAIMATSTNGGSIEPSGAILIQDGHDTTLTFSAQTGYHFDSLTVDGTRVDSMGSFTFHSVSTDHTIQAWFTINRDTIIAIAGVNGSVLPAGIVGVDYGSNQKFSIVPSPGYHVDSLIVDGVLQPADTEFTFVHVVANRSLRATFAIDYYTIVASAGTHGSIMPSGSISVAYGDSIVFAFHPDSLCHVDSILVDGVFVGRDSVYTLRTISASHIVDVRFTDGTMSISCAIANNWNMLSVPLILSDYSMAAVFPTAMSKAFLYDGSYEIADTFRNGVGYWVKFNGAQIVSVHGRERTSDTFYVNEGWNMIGSLSSTISTMQITSSPGGMVTSRFFGYNNGYEMTDSIRPGFGYWVKATQSGQLILSSGTGIISANRIRIDPTGDLPPAPPVFEQRSGQRPKTYALEQSYPNPFNPTAIVHFELPNDAKVMLKVYNVLGEEVATILDEVRPAGRYDVRIDGSSWPSGLYFYRLTSGKFSQSMKMILAK